MIVGEMTESRQKKVRIKEIDGWTLGMLIDYVYTAEIQVTEENVQVTVCVWVTGAPHLFFARYKNMTLKLS